MTPFGSASGNCTPSATWELRRSLSLRLVLVVARLSSIEIIQVDKITWTSGSPLHRPKVLKCAYRNRHVRHLDVDRPRSKLGVRQNSLQALDHVQVTELCSDQRSFAATQQRCNGALGAEQRLPQLHVTAERSRNTGERIQISGDGSGTMSQSFVPRTTPHDPSAKPPIATKRTSARKRRTRSWSNEGPLKEHAAPHRATRTACVSTRSSLRGSPRAAAAHPRATAAAAHAHPPHHANVARIAQASHPTPPRRLLQNQTCGARAGRMPDPHQIRAGPVADLAMTRADRSLARADQPTYCTLVVT